VKIFTSCCFYQQVLPPGIRRLSENKLIVPEAAPRQRDILAGLPPASFSSKSRRIEQLFTSINTKILLKIRRSDVQTFRRSDVQTFRRSDVQTFRRSDVQTFRRSDVQTFTRSHAQTLTRSHGAAFGFDRYSRTRSRADLFSLC